MRHCDPVTMDHIIELRKRVALLEKQLENALSYVRPLFEQQRRYLEDIGSSTIRVGEETKFSRDARSFNGEK